MSYLFKYLRHWSMAKRLTPARLANCLRLAWEFKQRKETVASYPVVARINACPFCNLKCLACQVIAGREASRPAEAMTLDRYRHVIAPLSDHLLLVVLYDEGEPLLNRELPEIVRYTSSLNISTSISTSLSMELSDRYLRDLAASGLDRITVSIDGATQQIYQSYRAGGNLALVRENLRRLVGFKRRRRASMHIEVQFLELGFNDHEAGAVRSFAAEAGADGFRSLQSSAWGLERYLAERGLTLGVRDHLRLGCLDLWGIAHIDSSGLLFPCDFGEDNGLTPLGDLLREDFRELWNGAYLRGLRAGFSRQDGRLGCSVCKRCPSTNRAPLLLR